jgi:hypothetical protein
LAISMWKSATLAPLTSPAMTPFWYCSSAGRRRRPEGGAGGGRAETWQGGDVDAEALGGERLGDEEDLRGSGPRRVTEGERRRRLAGEPGLAGGEPLHYPMAAPGAEIGLVAQFWSGWTSQAIASAKARARAFRSAGSSGGRDSSRPAIR